MKRVIVDFEASLDWFYLARTTFWSLPLFGLILVNLPDAHVSVNTALYLIPSLMLVVGVPLAVATKHRSRRGQDEPTSEPNVEPAAASPAEAT